MPLWLVADDLAAGRLVSIELEGPAAGVVPFHAAYLADRFPGQAGWWLLDRLAFP